MKKLNITNEEISHLASLANLSLTESEKEKFKNQFSETLDYVENLKELDTDNVSDNSYIFDVENVNFEDKEDNARTFSQSDSLKNAKRKTDSYFIVEKIM